MTELINLAEGLWRFHTTHTAVADWNLLPPAQPSGTSSDALLRFTAQDTPLQELDPRFASTGVWYRSDIAVKEDPWDYEQGGKGELWAQVFAPAVGPHTVIQIVQSGYATNGQIIPGHFTMYVGRTEFVTPQPLFFGHGADNGGRQTLSFTLRRE